MNSTGRMANGERRYGCWAGNPKGNPEDLTRCVHEVFLGDRGGTHYQCNRKRGFGEDGLYCRQHDPKYIAEKSDARKADFDAKRKAQDKIGQRAKYLARRLGVAGSALYVSQPRFSDCGYVEQLVISFADAEKLIARLEEK